jgi:hypothetical protein
VLLTKELIEERGRNRDQTEELSTYPAKKRFGAQEILSSKSNN